MKRSFELIGYLLVVIYFCFGASPVRAQPFASKDIDISLSAQEVMDLETLLAVAEPALAECTLDAGGGNKCSCQGDSCEFISDDVIECYDESGAVIKRCSKTGGHRCKCVTPKKPAAAMSQQTDSYDFVRSDFPL